MPIRVLDMWICLLRPDLSISKSLGDTEKLDFPFSFDEQSHLDLDFIDHRCPEDKELILHLLKELLLDLDLHFSKCDITVMEEGLAARLGPRGSWFGSLLL